MRLQGSLPPCKSKDAGSFRLLVTCHRRENWGVGAAQVAAAVCDLAQDPGIRVDLILHPNARLTADMAEACDHSGRIRIHPPRSHAQLVQMMCDCDLLVSDSGGMQEEAPALGTPMLILRNKTERPEGIETGNMRLVGCATSEITSTVRTLRADPVALAAMSRPAFPYGDGKASARIASIVKQWAEERFRLRRSAV